MFLLKKEIMLITKNDIENYNDYSIFIEEMIKSGITSVQFRAKNKTYEEIYELGHNLRKICSLYHVSFIINDNLEWVKYFNADGLHIGKSDGDAHYIRKMLGDDKIIGLSVENIDDVNKANKLPIDYIGVGAVFPTISKIDAANVSLNGLFKINQLSIHPVIAVGGIDEKNIDQLPKYIDGVAVIAAIHNAQAPKEIISKMRKILG